MGRGIGAQNLKSQEPRAKSQEPRAKSQEPRAKSQEPRAKSQEPRAKSQEPRAKSQEPRAKSQEPRAKSQEPRATSDLSLPARTIAPSALSCGRTLLTAVFALASVAVLSVDNALAQGTVATDRAALVALYDATGGANWTNSTNWKSTEALSEWFRVGTDADGRVTELLLYENGLSGEIPAALGDLASLQRLYLHENALNGEIPEELGDSGQPPAAVSPRE